MDHALTANGPAPDIRPLGQAMMRGVRGRCPACGEGPVLSGYLTPRAACPSCAEDLSAQRTDDGPAYVTILFVSHLVLPLLLVAYMAWRPSPIALIIGFCALAATLSLLMLPRVKGAMIGLQWAKRMHGFGETGSGRP